MTSTPDMELKIVEAAIAVIEKHGVRNATVRRIAQEAGVNVAAINYYFHTKEQLMDRVMAVTLENAFDWSHFEWSDELPPKPRLIAILDYMVMGTQAYPEISRVHFLTPMIDKAANQASYAAFSGFLEKVYADMVSRGVAPGEDLRFALLQAVSAAILGIGLHTDICQRFTSRDLRDPAVRKQYVERLVDRIL